MKTRLLLTVVLAVILSVAQAACSDDDVTPACPDLGGGLTDSAVPPDAARDSAMCNAGLSLCSSKCANLQKDRDNCGACGTTCKAGEVCVAGKCAVSCQSALTNCGGTCVNTKTDRLHCGACNATCKAGEVCASSKCALSCQSLLTACNGTCINLKTDAKNCGMCAKACLSGWACSQGICTLTCPAGLSTCNGTCVDTQTSLAHCGTCAKKCTAGHVCTAGKCALSCQSGLTACSGVCVNTKSDNLNCGKCGGKCAAGQVCSFGACALTCGVGLTACSGSCVKIQTDDFNCGKCGTVCPLGQFCSSGVCVKACGNGKIDAGEQCDGAKLGGKTCTSLGYYGGTLSCGSSCALVSKACMTCGDGVINGPDKCDGIQLGGATCVSQGFAGGTLKCNSSCALDTSGCFKCTDKTKNGDETDVDCGGSVCSGCGAGKTCKVNTDCKEGICTGGSCRAPKSCKELLAGQPKLTSGTYTIDPNGGSIADAFKVHCEMSLGGGGWTLVAVISSFDGIASMTCNLNWDYKDSRWVDSKVLNAASFEETKDHKYASYSSLAFGEFLMHEKVAKKAGYKYWAVGSQASFSAMMKGSCSTLATKAKGYGGTISSDNALIYANNLLRNCNSDYTHKNDLSRLHGNSPANPNGTCYNGGWGLGVDGDVPACSWESEARPQIGGWTTQCYPQTGFYSGGEFCGAGCKKHHDAGTFVGKLYVR